MDPITPPTVPEKPIDVAAERKAALAEHRLRCKKIDEYVGGLRNAEWKARAQKIAEKHKEKDEPDFDAFRAEALDAFQNDVQLDPPGAAEVPAGGIRVIGERGAPILTAGKQFTDQKGFKDFVRSGGRGAFRHEVSDSFLSRRAEAGLSQRAGFASADLAAVNITVSQNLIPLGVQRLTIMDLIMPGAMSTSGFVYPVETSFDPFAYPAETVPERGLKPEWEPNLGTDRADAQVIAVMATVPKQFMEDFGAFSSYLDNRGDYLLSIKAEQQILYGDGVGSNLLGITSRPGIQTRPLGTVPSETTPDALFRGNTDIETNAYFDVDGYAMHPYDWEQIRLLKDLNGQYIAGGPFYAPYGTGGFVKFSTLWGLPVAVTKSVKQGRPIAGAWRAAAQYFMRQGLTIETSTSHKDYFQRNLLAILFEERMALAVYRPVAFLEHTGFPGRS